MKLLMENWREYLNDHMLIDPEIIKMIEEYVDPLPIKAIYLYGSSALSPKEQEEQDIHKHGQIQSSEERDVDVWVQLDIDYEPELMDKIHTKWEKSDEFWKLQEDGYDVRLGPRDEAIDKPNILVRRSGEDNE